MVSGRDFCGKYVGFLCHRQPVCSGYDYTIGFGFLGTVELRKRFQDLLPRFISVVFAWKIKKHGALGRWGRQCRGPHHKFTKGPGIFFDAIVEDFQFVLLPKSAFFSGGGFKWFDSEYFSTHWLSSIFFHPCLHGRLMEPRPKPWLYRKKTCLMQVPRSRVNDRCWNLIGELTSYEWCLHVFFSKCQPQLKR